MRITVWSGILFYLVSLGLVLVIIYYTLGLAEKVDKKAKTVLAELLILICGGLLVTGTIGLCVWFLIESADVIEVDGRRYEVSSWRVYYKANGQRFRVHTGRTYLYDASINDTNLVLTPIYYHISPDSVGRKVANPLPREHLLPGFHELDHVPLFVFRAPKYEYITPFQVDKKILYHLGRKGDEVPDYYLKLVYEPDQSDDGL